MRDKPTRLAAAQFKIEQAMRLMKEAIGIVQGESRNDRHPPAEVKQAQAGKI